MGGQFSNLPNELAINILSDLSFEEMVRCTRVSKRWRCLIMNAKELWLKVTSFPVNAQTFDRLDSYFMVVDPPISMSITSIYGLGNSIYYDAARSHIYVTVNSQGRQEILSVGRALYTRSAFCGVTRLKLAVHSLPHSEVLSVVENLANLRHLELHGVAVCDCTDRKLSGNLGLEELRLSHVNWRGGNEYCRLVDMFVERCPKLKVLDIDDSTLQGPMEALVLCQTSVRQLHLETARCLVGLGQLEHLSVGGGLKRRTRPFNSFKLPNIKTVTVDDTGQQEDGEIHRVCEVVQFYRCSTTIERLKHINYQTVPRDNHGIIRLPECPNLRELILFYADRQSKDRIGHADITGMLASFPKLELIVAIAGLILDEGLLQLAAAGVEVSTVEEFNPRICYLNEGRWYYDL
jgi:hypothetical protein